MSSGVVSPHRLLLVDANPSRLEAIATVLRDLGFGVTCAPTVEEGQAVLAAATVDAVISISSPEPLRHDPGSASGPARPIVAVAVSPPEQPPPNGSDGVIRLPLRAPDLVRAIRKGLDGLRHG